MNKFQERIGVGGRTFGSGLRPDAKRVIPALVEEGPRSGKVGGFHTEHASGRVDATVTPSSIRLKAAQSED